MSSNLLTPNYHHILCTLIVMFIYFSNKLLLCEVTNSIDAGNLYRVFDEGPSIAEPSLNQHCKSFEEKVINMVASNNI